MIATSASIEGSFGETTCASGVLEDDPLENVGNVFAAVRGCFQVVDDVAPLHDHEGVVAALEELCEAAAIAAVRLVFEAVDLHAEIQDLLGLLDLRQERDGLVHR